MNRIIGIMLGATLLLAPGASGHGNNPGNSWVGVSLGGIDFGMEPDVYTIVNTLWPDVLGVADDCANLAVRICGEGRVCCYCVVGSNGDTSCFFSCQDAEGHCEPCPECNPSTIAGG